MVIQVGDSTAAVKQEISDLLEYVTGDGEVTSWLNATNRINEVADLLGRDGIADGMAGATARARINALWDGPVWAPGADLAMDFREGLYYRGAVTDTHATDILALGSGGYETFAPNVPPITDLGLLTTVQSTRLTPWPRTPGTDWVLTGADRVAYPGTFLGVLSDACRVASQGAVWNRLSISPSTPWTSGVSYGFAFVYSSGTSGRCRIVLRDNTASVESRRSGLIGGGLTDTSPAAGNITNFSEMEVEPGVWLATGTFTANSTPLSCQFSIGPDSSVAGEDIIVYGGWLESAPFATDIILGSEGSAVTRPGNMPVIDLTGRLGEGVAGVYQMDWLGVESSARQLTFSDGSAVNGVQIEVGSGGGPRWQGYLDGSPQGVGAISNGAFRKTGLITVAFAVVDGFRSLRVVGDTQRDDPGKPLPPGLNRLGIGGAGYGSSNNTYAQFKRLALKFGPQDQDSFDEMYALAQEWAAE